MTLARGFSRQHGLTHFATTAPHHASAFTSGTDLPTPPAYTLAPVQPLTGMDYPPASPHHSTHTKIHTPTTTHCDPPESFTQRTVRNASTWQGPLRIITGTGLSTRYPSTTPDGLALGPDSPWADEPTPGTLSQSAVQILTVLSLLMSAFSLPHPPPPITRWLHRMQDAPLPTCTTTPTPKKRRWITCTSDTASVMCLAPLHYRRATTKPVSYYALFQGWLLLSQPPGCLRNHTTFPTQHTLRDLSRCSGLFPSRPRTLSPAVSLPHNNICGIRSLADLSNPIRAHQPTSALPPQSQYVTLHLNAFRGEPAITEFD